jgi:THO complex subunit 4
MSSNKMEQSLDDILKASKTSRRGRSNRRSGAGRPATAAAPVGGVAKSTKQAKPTKAAPAAPAAVLGGETKIMVSNLPRDIDQAQLQDYFASAINVGRPKKVLLQYDAAGRSVGSATIIFNKHEQAAKATAALDGVKIDGRPVRVEMLVSPSVIPAAARPASLADRVTQPKKDKPKPATTEKATAGAARGKGQTRGRGKGRGGRDARPKKKTVEELDAEMADYFPGGEANNATSNTEVAPVTAGGDTAMDDEML